VLGEISGVVEQQDAVRSAQQLDEVGRRVGRKVTDDDRIADAELSRAEAIRFRRNRLKALRPRDPNGGATSGV
jgi:hypothetical protein